MASSDPGRDKDTSSDKSENPFIKFRRFADAQIGTVLQSVIGLPSVFNKQGNDANRRWGDFQENLKRREEGKSDVGKARAKNGSGMGEAGGVVEEDEEEVEIPVRKLVERLPIAPESERRNLESDEQVEIPVKKFLRWSSPAPKKSQSPKTSTMPHEEGGLNDVDLYSSITNTLFAHHKYDTEAENDWSKTPITQMGYDNDKGALFELSDRQKRGGPLNLIQENAYNELKYSALNKRFSNPYEQNLKSLLPYILFSKYSPLALSNALPLRRAEELEQTEDFPWCAAFEDLLLTSRGRPMGLWMHVSRHPMWDRLGFVPSYDLSVSTDVSGYVNRAAGSIESLESKNVTRKTHLAMAWIDRLDAYGLLSPGPTSIWDILEEDLPRPWYTKLIAKEQSTCPDSAQPESENDDLSEQDMYDEFLEHVTAYSGDDGPITSQDIEDVIDNAHLSTLDMIRTTARDTRFGFGRTSPNSIRRVCDFDFGAFIRGESYWGRKFKDTPSLQPVPLPTSASQSTQTESHSDHGQPEISKATHNYHRSTLEQLIEDVFALSKPISISTTLEPRNKPSTEAISDEGPDKIVSTTTTTEQTTTETGTVETTVTIEKVFADGRKYVNVTEHVEVPSQSQSNSWNTDVEQCGHEHEEEWAERKQKEQEKGEKGDEDNGKRRKEHKGWFWN